MGKTSTKLAVYALVQLLLFHLSGLDATADFYFRFRADDCNGTALEYRDVPAYDCVTVDALPAGSVEVHVMAESIVGFYGGGECTDVILADYGSRCALGGGYTGAMWVPYSHPPDAAEKGCDAQAKPTGIAYSEDSTDGRWILTTDNATEMYTQMETIPDAQKVDWLQAHGATVKPGL